MAFELTSGEQIYLAMLIFAALAFILVTMLCRIDYSRWRKARVHGARPSDRARAAPAE